MDVYYLTAEDVKKYDMSLLKRVMPARFAKAQAYRREKDRLLCLGGAILMADIVGIKNEADISFNRFGKPFANGFPAFSISHGGDVCVLVTGNRQVGIDLERADRGSLSIAEQVLSDREYEWMRAEPVARFHRLWTLKESLLKAVGTGLVDDMKRVDVMPFTSGAPVTYNETVWYASETRHEDCFISICSSEPIENICMVPWWSPMMTRGNGA